MIRHITVPLALLLLIYSFCIDNALAENTTSPTVQNKALLQERVTELWDESNVYVRGEVDVFFQLGDIHADEGEEEAAIRVYTRGLQADAWRNDYQLKLAALLARHGESKQALEIADSVIAFEKDKELVRQAKTLKEQIEQGTVPQSVNSNASTSDANVGENSNALPVETTENTIPSVSETSPTILIVPIGAIDKTLIKEAAGKVQAMMGIRFIISNDQIDPGQFDRSYAEHQTRALLDGYLPTAPKEEIQSLLDKTDLKYADLNDYKLRKKFLLAAMQDAEMSEIEINQVRDGMKALEQDGQHSTARLLVLLKNNYNLNNDSGFVGYLGITEKDIYDGKSKKSNFLFASGSNGFTVSSYHRYTAEFNNEKPNHKKLLERTINLLLWSTGQIANLRKCTTTNCPRAYVHSLQELDKNTPQLCQTCNRGLEVYLRNKGI